ncbi:fungal peroxidase [Mycena rebaudengoi]|nr:fungal peroxidase [Mycena rebaudengoi]
MKLLISPAFLFLSLLSGVQLAASVSVPSFTGVFSRGLAPRRKDSMLINPKAFGDLPTAAEAKDASTAVDLNLDDIQGDILIGMSKKRELFFFFSIQDAKTFKSHLASDILPLVTSTTPLLDISTQPQTALNIAFSQTGLTALGVTESLGDSVFSKGQFKGADKLGDPGTGNWVPAFAGTKVHGVILLASDTQANIDSTLASLKAALGTSINELYSLQGAARPGEFAGHEHFGYMDGISQPGVEGFTKTLKPGRAMVSTGKLLLGMNGDSDSRPAWAKGGSFLVFRQLEQLVPEFNKYLTDNTIVQPGLTVQQGADLLGARMIGRWKSGAPIDLAPTVDDPALGSDPDRNNDFTFSHTGENIQKNQTRCPFSAHIRKTRPRADLGTPEDDAHHIMRAGIPYGPEVTDTEAAAFKTSTERGLAFVCYQADIGKGFQFMQDNWANSESFNRGTGPDPIIGANKKGDPRSVTGLDPANPNKSFKLPTAYVVSRGGEYFFSPSLSAIASTLSV